MKYIKIFEQYITEALIDDYPSYMANAEKIVKLLDKMMPKGVKKRGGKTEGRIDVTWHRTMDGKFTQLLRFYTYADDDFKRGLETEYFITAGQDEDQPDTILGKFKSWWNGDNLKTRKFTNMDIQGIPAYIGMFGTDENLAKIASRIKPVIQNTFTDKPMGGTGYEVKSWSWG
jgi:hypothetical protein